MSEKIEWGAGTPGPWAREADNNVCRQISGEFHAICTDQFCYAPEGEKEANARAIAEVPAMVVALRDALGCLADLDQDGRDTKADIRAILSKIDATS